MNAVGVSILVFLILVVLFAPRRWALLGMVAGVLYLTQLQQVTVVGYNLFAIRFLELAGFLRVMARREFSFASLNSIDKAFLALYLYATIVFLLRSKDGQAYQIGMAVDAFLCYFAFRGLIGGIEDFCWFLRAFVILLIPFVGLVLAESFTGKNPFAAMGAVTEFVRDGRARCQGSFRHPSLLGTLGATFVPLYIGMALARRDFKFAVMGIGLCLAIVWAANSGGPINTTLFGVIGWLLWKARLKMRLVRWSIVAAIAVLAMFMSAPVWYLLAKMSSLSGGDGWHRSYLIDVALRNIDKWWLAGMPVEDTGDWFPYIIMLTGGADITNQFVAFGITAGLVATVLFIVLFVRAFSNLGRAMEVVRFDPPDSGETELMLWGLGAMLVAHIVNVLGITYFDQTSVIWFMQLAAISNLSERCIGTVEIMEDHSLSEEGEPAMPSALHPEAQLHFRQDQQ